MAWVRCQWCSVTVWRELWLKAEGGALSLPDLGGPCPGGLGQTTAATRLAYSHSALLAHSTTATYP